MKFYIIVTALLLLTCAEVFRDFTGCKVSKVLYIFNNSNENYVIKFIDKTEWVDSTFWGVSSYDYQFSHLDTIYVQPNTTVVDSYFYEWEVEHGSEEDDYVCRTSGLNIKTQIDLFVNDSLYKSEESFLNCSDFELVEKHSEEGSIKMENIYRDVDSLVIE